ncbi:MAG: hypothetical protein C5B47_07390 [Verrucomicrobia bacterium]|nr:MAG: hypothetical protein C5B47_07390 [Verrucomicrobiota bacterium]
MNDAPAPLHDIAPPVPFFPYPLWMVILGAVILLGLCVLLIWIAKIFFFKKRKMSPPEKALAALSLLRARIKAISPYDFGVEVSDILRHYIHEEHGLRAPTQTSLEFLESIRNNAVFAVEEKAMLGKFLQTVDLIKFAKAEVSLDESASLLEQAKKLVHTRHQN